ncbi:MAG: hypothetical protein RL272_149 [Candidatus Parcubacteria bacterium]|jgi:hypothetical protein
MERPKEFPLAHVVIVAVVAAVFAGVTALVSMFPEQTDDAGAYRAVGALGFTEQSIVARYPGHVAAWQSGCGEDDMSAVDMRANDAAGKARVLLVCCGGHVGRTGCSVRAR